jgi:hypothetical protein
MKLPILLLLLLAFTSSLCAQKCLDLSVLSLMTKLEVPGNAAAGFASCSTRVNENNQTEIVDYGVYMKDLDTLVTQKLRDFNIAFMSGSGDVNSQMPSAQTIEDSKKLVEDLKSMTPEQQKEWAMQQVNKQMAAKSSPAVMQDDPAVTRLVMQTYGIAANQLPALDREFAAKYRTIESARSAAMEKVPEPDRSMCPAVDKIGMPACACVNKLAAKYFGQKLIIEDQYDAQKIALYQSYIGEIKGLVQQVDQNIVKLNFGAGIKSKQMQKMLFSSQSGAFGNAFDFTYVTITAIHKDGSDLYVNKFNSDKNAYDLSCAR